MTGLPNPKWYKIPHCFGVILDVYLGHGVFHRVAVLFSPNPDVEEVINLPYIRTSEKNVVHVFRDICGTTTNREEHGLVTVNWCSWVMTRLSGVEVR